MNKITASTVFTVIFIVFLSFSITFSGSAQASVIGGSINSQDLSLVVGVEEPTGIHALLGATEDGYFLGSGRALNRLVIVDYMGRWSVASRAFADGHGISVALPTNGRDKIVYLNSRGFIRGGMGLSPSEVSQVVSYYQLASLLPALRFLSMSGQVSLYSAVENARLILPIDRYLTSRDTAAYVTEVSRLGGTEAGQTVSNILTAAMASTTLPDFRAGTLGTSLAGYLGNVSMAPGLDWVSEIDNGGGGRGIVDPGTWLSEIDNGGGGRGIVAIGWKSSVDPGFPVISNLDAHPDGTFVYAY